MPAESATAPPRPNVILFFADDLGYGDLGCFGHPTSKTPFIDALAARGAKMTQYYSAAAICSPSRASLMTGRLFPRLGVYPGVFSPLSVGGLPLNATTIADRLGATGYRTGGLGKWHLGVDEYLPTNRGFDFYFGIPMTQNECFSNIRSPGSALPGGRFGGCPLFNTTSSRDDPKGSPSLRIVRQGNGTYPADTGAVDMLDIDSMYDDAMAGFVRESVSAGDPFFFYFASHHVHAPQFADAAMTNETLRGLFGDSLAVFDRSVGRATELVQSLGIENDTLLILSSDNGGSLHWGVLGGVNGDLRCGKGTTWEGGHRVPAIAAWPGKIQPNSVLEGMTSSLDWVPTLCALAGCDNMDTDSDGFDISEYLLGQRQDSPRTVFFYHSTFGGGPRARPDTTGGGLMAIRSGAYKLHFFTAGSHCDKTFPDAMCYGAMTNISNAPLLFNVEQSPGEIINIDPSSDEYKTVTQELITLADQHRAKMEQEAMTSEIGKGSNGDRFPCCNECPKGQRPGCCRCEA